MAEYQAKFANPYVAAGRGYIDDVIEPRETRPRLIAALEMLQNKRDTNSAEEAREHPVVACRRTIVRLQETGYGHYSYPARPDLLS